MNGMNENPGQVYSIASRLVCDQCGEEPAVLSVKGDDPYQVLVSCHGETKLKSFTRKDLQHIQRVFAQDEA